MRRVLFFISSIVFLSLTLFFITGNDNDYKAKIDYGDGSYMEGVHIEQKKGGMLKWRMTAEKATHLNNDKIRLENVMIHFPEKDFTLSTKEALYSLNNRNLEIPGEIKAHARGYDIEGKNLRWDAVSSSLQAEGGIVIKGKGFLIEGEHLKASQDKAELNKNVKAVFYGN